MTVRFSDKNRGYKELLHRMSLAGIRSKRVAVGVLGAKASASHGGGMTNVDVATIHEFGAPGANIPERSFIRAGVDEKLITIRKTMVRLSKSYITGKVDLDQTLGIIGQQVVGVIQAKIASNVPPPLAAETIRRKRSSRALIDTGQLRQSISYEVRHVGEKA